ncbi:MAG: tetratricopeptide repeat protein [Deltaproteobacteria bacterium]|nr:tetratricopeptide repeat protein [Deltaproteobacteria bacterium]
MKTKLALLILVSLLGSACTDPGQTTAIGAATGGAVGAGLGAIIGNQSGNPGAGMAIGAISGAGIGGAIGNALEAQEKTIRSQDEALERSERMISSQRAEIEELKRAGNDSISFKPSSQSGREMRSPSEPYASTAWQREPVSPSFSSPAFPPSSAADSSATSSARGAYRWDDSRKTAAPAGTQASATVSSADSADCAQAEEEVRSGDRASNSADKLFHYRRALRLCPNRADFHNSLGETYLKLQRKEDAEFEFREALRVDPGFSAARQNLNAISR